MVVIIDSRAAKNEVCNVVLYGVSRPAWFTVIVHRDVVIGEILELEER